MQQGNENLIIQKTEDGFYDVCFTYSLTVNNQSDTFSKRVFSLSQAQVMGLLTGDEQYKPKFDSNFSFIWGGVHNSKFGRTLHAYKDMLCSEIEKLPAPPNNQGRRVANYIPTPTLDVQGTINELQDNNLLIQAKSDNRFFVELVNKKGKSVDGYLADIDEAELLALLQGDREGLRSDRSKTILDGLHENYRKLCKKFSDDIIKHSKSEENVRLVDFLPGTHCQYIDVKKYILQKTEQIKKNNEEILKEMLKCKALRALGVEGPIHKDTADAIAFKRLQKSDALYVERFHRCNLSISNPLNHPKLPPIKKGQGQGPNAHGHAK